MEAMAEELSIGRLLEARARQSRDAKSIVGAGCAPLTYAALRDHVADCVGTLNRLGVGRDDRVAVVLPNGPEMAVVFLAVAAGATCAPLNPDYRAEEFESYLKELHPAALIIQAGSDTASREVAQAIGIRVLEISPLANAAAGLFALRGPPDKERTRSIRHGFSQPQDVALILPTSGTTSKPKLVPLTHANICTSAHNIRLALYLHDGDRCLNVMPLFHIHGLIGALLSSLAAGASVVCTPGSSHLRFFEWLAEIHPTWYTAVPSVHQMIVEMAEVNREIISTRPLRFIRSSSSPLPVRLMGDLERTFRAPVIEAYGMTEASHQVASNSLPPGIRKAGSVGKAAGPRIAIMDETGVLLKPGETGEIVIRGRNVFQGYEGIPATNASAFTDGWFRTGDQGYLDSAGYLFITGRFKELINRGGEKISPREVEEVLVQHPAVAQAVAYSVPHATLGEDVAAAIVLRNGALFNEKEVQSFVASRLADFKIPRNFVVVDEIPKTPTGKLQRNGLAERLGMTSPVRRREFVAPRDPLELQIAGLWEELLHIHPIGVVDDFFELGGNSLQALRLLARVEKEMGKNLPLNAIFAAPTIEQWVKILCQEGEPAPNAFLVPLKHGGSKAPFFCVHGVRNWARHIAPDRPFFALVPHGLDGYQAPATVEEMAASYIRMIRAQQPVGPYYLGGYSFGGLVAFEMAQQLRKQNEEVALLVLIEPASPLAHRGSFRTKVSLLREKVGRHATRLAPLTADQKLKYIFSKFMQKFEQMCKELLCLCFLKVCHRLPPFLRRFYFLAVNRKALTKYRPAAYPDRIIFLLAEDSPYDFRKSWPPLASGGVEVSVLAGDHGKITEEPHAKVWGEQISTCLERSGIA